MDARSRNAYVRYVNLLLLLSALLSALTGAGVTARAAPVAVSVSLSANDMAAARQAPAQVRVFPPASLPVLRAVVMAEIMSAWRLAAPTPLFASRRRE